MSKEMVQPFPLLKATPLPKKEESATLVHKAHHPLPLIKLSPFMIHIPSIHHMASDGSKSVSISLLFLNLVLYIIVAIVAGWAVNYGIKETAEAASQLSVPVRLFPIYYPIGNMATGFFVIFSLLAGVVGIGASLSGLQNLTQGSMSNVASAAASSIMAWGLVLLAMGLACKEISYGWRTASLRTLETLTIILSGTQLLCTVAIHSGLSSSSSSSSSSYPHPTGHRV